MQALKAEIFPTFHKAEYHHRFSSAEQDGKGFRLMFPGHPSEGNYRCSSTKSAYFLRYGISEVLKAGQMLRCSNSMTISSAIEVTNTYAGSLFMGLCTTDDMVIHFYKIVQPLDLKDVNLSHLGMDGPRVNKKFGKELQALFHEKTDTSVLLLGAFSLHPVHTAFKNGILEVNLPCETFFNDLVFFMLSAARLDDYVGVGVATGIAAEFAKKFGATQSLCMKQVWILRICEKCIMVLFSICMFFYKHTKIRIQAGLRSCKMQMQA